MSIQSARHKIQLTLPEPLYHWFFQTAQQQTQEVTELIQTALEYYAQRFDVTQTRTWDMCGTFAVAKTDTLPLNSNALTNYAEHVDAVIYGEDK